MCFEGSSSWHSIYLGTEEKHENLVSGMESWTLLNTKQELLLFPWTAGDEWTALCSTQSCQVYCSHINIVRW
jgi:hypothetical protein